MRDYTECGFDTSKFVQCYKVTKKGIIVTLANGNHYYLDKESEIFLQQLMSDKAKEVYEKKDELQENIDREVAKNRRLRFFGEVGTVVSMIGLGYTLIESAPGVFQSISLAAPGLGIVGSLCLYGCAKYQQRKLYELEDDLDKIEFFFDHSNIFAMDIQNVDRVMLGLTKKQRATLKMVTSGLPIVNVNSIDCLSCEDLEMLAGNMIRTNSFEQQYPTSEKKSLQKKMI